MGKKYKIIKATDPKLIGVVFEYAILNNMQPPKWFTGWSEAFEKRIDSRFDRLEADVADLKVRMTKVETTLQEHGKDIKNIHSILERNNIR